MPCIQNIRVKCYMKKINVNINQKITEYIYIYICPADVLPQKKGKHINNIDLDLLYSYIGVRHLCNEQTSLKRSMNRHMTRK